MNKEPINVEPTAEIIDLMAMRAEDSAKELRRTAKSMRERNDLTYAAEAISTATNLMNLLRLDLLVTRPIREMQLREFKKEASNG